MDNNQKKTIKSLNVVVTGAAGQIAYSLLPILCSGQIFGSDVRVNLRLLGMFFSIKIFCNLIIQFTNYIYLIINNIII